MIFDIFQELLVNAENHILFYRSFSNTLMILKAFMYFVYINVFDT